MKIGMMYFSGTGNTWFVAENLRKCLESKGAEVTMLSIEEDSMKDPEEVKQLVMASDKIILGYPVYGSIAPYMMIDFINALPEVNCPKSINVFTTVALYSGDGPVMYSEVFESKGYILHTGKEFIMNNNFNVPGFPDVLHVGDEVKIYRRHIKVLPKIDKMAERIVSNDHKIQGKAFYDKALGNLQRAHIDAYITKVSETLLVDDDQCVNCGKCIRFCPMSNISEQDGRIVFGDDCMACMRCYHLCPKHAVNVSDASMDTEKWPRFYGVYREFEKSVVR